MCSVLRYLICVGLAVFQLANASSTEEARIEQRVDSILRQLTLEEKIGLLGGERFFDIDGVPRVGLPTLLTADGPFGVRRYARANATAGGIALAATWNTELAAQLGREMGRDARARGVHFYLAPGVNIYRAPQNGRNFEYLGEDPLLASRIAVEFIKGVQSQGVAATVKHFLANNSEFARHTSDAIIDERALREIYLPAFEAAVKEANVAAVMDSYNLVNGEHLTQSRRFNVDLLKNEWGFKGLVMSDWFATYDTLGAANGGLDLEMPSGQHLNLAALQPLLRSGSVSEASIDDKVRRMLRLAARFGWLDRAQLDRTIPMYNPQGRAVALQTAREGIVLLRNEGNVLPLNRNKLQRIAVIGPNGYPAVTHGGGSVTVAPFRTVSLLEGLSDELGEGVDVHYLRGIPDLKRVAQSTRFRTAPSSGEAGLAVEVFANAELAGPPASLRIDPYINQGAPLDLTAFATGDLDLATIAAAESKPTSTRWTGYYTPEAAGKHDLFVQMGGFERICGYRLFVDNKLVADRWDLKIAAVEQWSLMLDASPHRIVLERRSESGGLGAGVPFARLGIAAQGQWVDPAALELAGNVDAVVLAVGYDASTETEDWDRAFALPPGQDELIERIAGLNKNTIVVLTSGGAVDMNRWLERVPALLQAWYPGQEGGTALAEILLGEVNPSGRLPATFERRWEDNPVYASYYPAPGSNEVIYKEGVFMGYRGYEKNKTQPLFPFGHGLSYTTFAFGQLKVEARPGSKDVLFDVSFTVTNTGDRAGSTVAQVYVADRHSRAARPPKELRGFAKVPLNPGESRTVTIPLDARAFAYYDAKARKWRADAGTFGVLVGSSSAQIELKGEAKLTRSLTL